ncbi:helix-turn-helix domain-containing protein [Leifsonia sp. McL0607]|uniref:helix-turn-helix domain-containing protein n=1 Tax=Leifsonia sp. McL0607 TaxID=3415672 RepID=UPI003CF9A00D
MPGAWPPHAAVAAQDTMAADALTGREREIAMLAGRFTNVQIGELLSISGRTVENHLARAMRKSGVRSRTDLYDVVSAPQGPNPRRPGQSGPSRARG